MLAVVCTTTLFLLWTAFMLFRFLGLPGYLEAFAALLFVVEFVAVLVIAYEPNGTMASRTAEAVATQDVPALGLLLYGISLAYARRAYRGVITRSRGVTTHSRSAR
jgi:hypothetical protein